jgi:hypothetical protein
MALAQPNTLLMPTDLAAGREESPDQARGTAEPIGNSLGPETLLLIFSDSLDDFERVRMATANRIGALRRDKGLEGSPEEARLQGVLDGLTALEHGVELELKRALRKHPLGPWVKQTVGVGEKQAARLLGVIGDPYWNTLHDRPRTVSELWAYCGYHVLPTQSSSDPQRTFGGESVEGNPGHGPDETHGRVAGVAPRRARGQRANWNTLARSRCYLIAESCIKQAHSPYRKVYDDARAKYADATHASPCVQCGTKGKPAPAGSDLRDGHKHARGLRMVAKAMLKDLWLAARDAHIPSEHQSANVVAGAGQ